MIYPLAGDQIDLMDIESVLSIYRLIIAGMSLFVHTSFGKIGICRIDGNVWIRGRIRLLPYCSGLKWVYNIYQYIGMYIDTVNIITRSCNYSV